MKDSKNIATIFSILGLAALLLLSPCKLRNFIQSELGVDQTQVTNKSKSLASQSSCQFQDIIQTKSAQSPSDVQQFSDAGHINFSIDFEVASLSSSVQNEYIRPNLASSVPLYILFNHFKVYL
ncbi:hypothetical protein [Psychroflexus lacisalsi]|uniref:hypothetical protein n=1 Tax=Psychroflexus lacisalsi TaxID=503928 RepID=UPI001CCF6CA6|nr:hypothetical protein [Psychroflexus lacisalsi]MBZ9619547.1 hypothetical protein [Psychroflexus lacisalsi]